MSLECFINVELIMVRGRTSWQDPALFYLASYLYVGTLQAVLLLVR